jgi:hypothetical protein
MCLSVEYDKRSREFRRLPDKIKGYKVINKEGNELPHANGNVKAGINEFLSNLVYMGDDKYYKGGSHVFLDKWDAFNFKKFWQRVIAVHFNKKDINTFGRQDLDDSSYTVTVKKFTVKSLKSIQ